MSTIDSRPRAGTIIWAVIMLAIAAFAFAFAVLDLGALANLSVIWIITGLGGILIVAAIVALIARGFATAAPAVEPVTTEDQPVD